MALPSRLLNFNSFNDGNSWMGAIEEIKLPKLAWSTDSYQGGGMIAPVEVIKGLDKLEIEQIVAGFCLQAYKSFGVTKANGVLIRFSGAYQAEDTDTVQAVEVVVRGRHKEIDSGSSKMGDGGKTTIKSSLTYYKLTVDGQVIIEIDTLAMICSINGKDILADQRKAIGLM